MPSTTALVMVVAVAALLVLGASSGLIDLTQFFQPAEVAGFTPIFCSEYEFKCCSIHAQGTGGGANDVFFYQCPTPADRCSVDEVRVFWGGFGESCDGFNCLTYGISALTPFAKRDNTNIETEDS